ncbi:MAG: MmgE/PrpD family protein, partial [Pseudomonadota bacterium]
MTKSMTESEISEAVMAPSLAAAVDWLWHDDVLRDPTVASRARLLLLDCLGCALAALAKPELAAIAAALRVDEPGPIVLPAVGGGFTTASAASLLAMAICWDEACEGLPRAHGRPGIHAAAPAVALALARAGDRPASLGDVLRALVVGYEIGGRMGAAFRIKPGMHVDGTWGTFGAVAAVAHLRGLAAPATLDALNSAACQLPYSLYLPITGGHTARNVYLGHAAALALLVTAAAAGGVTAPAAAPATQRRLALGLEPAVALAPPGVWLILEGYLKNFAAVRHVHYGAACALAWRAAVGAPVPPIRALKLAVYQEALTYCPNRAPRSAIQAQFSLSFGLVRTLLHGSLEPDAYGDAVLVDPALQRLEQLVEIAADPALTARGAILTVVSDRGDWQGRSADSADDPERPMTEAAVEAKFRRYAAPALGDRVSALADLILRGQLDAPFSFS